MRLDKFLQLTLHMNKQDIQAILKANRVMVNAVVVNKGKFIISGKESCITMDGREIKEEPYIYLMVNKPSGILSALKDKQEKTILDLIEHPRKHVLRIMGRLDRDTTGLIILTNHNALIKQVTLPDSHIEKEYEVVLLKPIQHSAIALFAKGIVIDQVVTLKPAQLIIQDDYHVRVIISEGKYHQIKKMFLSLDNQVVQLKRIRIGQLYLDNTLSIGEYRPLYKEEIDKIKSE